MMVIENDFNIGEAVYLKTDNDQNERVVTGIQVSPHGLFYRLVNGTTETWHYNIEINREKNVLKKMDAEKSAE
jgi:hypothetical protein